MQQLWQSFAPNSGIIGACWNEPQLAPTETLIINQARLIKQYKYNSLFCSYNGYLPQGDRGRRRSKFVLVKRTEPSGVKRSKHYIVQSPQTSKAILDANQHSISYTLSRNQAVIVEYKEDTETDMFQVRIKRELK